MAALLGGHLFPSEGSVEVLGERYGRVNLREHRRRLGMFQPVQQETLGIFHPRMTSLDVVCTGLDGSLASYRDYTQSEREGALGLFERLRGPGGLPAEPDRPFAYLSSGERRKVLLLRLLMGRPELILLDEPFESLDLLGRVQLEALLVTVVRQMQPTALIILHRPEEIPPFISDALLLKDGRVFATGPLEAVMNSEVVSKLYGTPVHVGREHGRYYWMPAETL